MAMFSRYGMSASAPGTASMIPTCLRWSRGQGRQADEVADRLVEPVIGPAPEQVGLLGVGPLVEVVPQLVVHRVEIVGVDAGAHLHPDVLVVVHVPGRGVADDFPVAGPGDHRPLPEGVGQRVHAHRGVEALAGLHHPGRVIALGDEGVGQVVAGARDPLRCGDVVDVAPALGPHVAGQVGADRACLRLHGVAVLGVQPSAHIAVQVLARTARPGPRGRRSWPRRRRAPCRTTSARGRRCPCSPARPSLRWPA